DALAPLLVASPGSGPPGSPNLSPRVFGRASTSTRETVRYATHAMITRVSAIATRPRPKFKPPRLGGTPSQSAYEAPSGLVKMYAHQKATSQFSPARRLATSGVAYSAVNSRPETNQPRCQVYELRSPSAVPIANVARTVAQ